MKWLQFYETGPPIDEKAVTWRVVAYDGLQLGLVRWNPDFQSFLFEANADTIYGPLVLYEIADFIKKKTKERKTNKKG